MGFERTSPEARPSHDELVARMVGIGMSFTGEPDVEADIEDTIVNASALGMDDGDLRVLSVLTTWLGVHHAHVNADRLVRLVQGHASERVRAYWSAVARWLHRDRRFARLVRLYDGGPVNLLPVGTDFQIKRHGEDERFASSMIRVPGGTLRHRLEDVLSPALLVQRHAGYRNRVRIGPTWRADVWTVLERAPDDSIAEIARAASCSFSTAWQAAQDFRLLREARIDWPSLPCGEDPSSPTKP